MPQHADLRQWLPNLHAFLAVTDAGSIAQAARHIFKAPSAITRSIIELERAIGVPLFERKPRGMLRNAYGDAVLARARRIHEEIVGAAEELLRVRRRSGPSLAAVIGLLYSSRKLELLIQISEQHNISSAATRLGMSQAGASMALSRIEAVLGESLFERRMQGMIANDATQSLVVHARRVLAEQRHLLADISAISGTLAGSVVVGTTPLGRAHHFPNAIASVLNEHPGLRITTVEGLYEPLVNQLRSGDVDIIFGVLRPPSLCHGLLTEPLFTDRLSIVVRKGHRLTRRSRLQIADLLTEHWILPRPGTPGRSVVDEAFGRLGLQAPIPSVETGDLAVLRPLLEVSNLLAVASPHQLLQDIAGGTLVELRVAFGEATRQIGMTVRDGARLSPAVLAVMNAARRHMHESRREAATAP